MGECMKRGVIAAAIAAVLLVPAGVAAQAWPSKPVRVVVSFPPGSTPDTVARVLSSRLQDALGQPFVVENRAGAGGNIGADAVAKSAPDGYTLLVSTNAAVATNKVLYDNLPYDPERDLAPVSLLATAPQALVVIPAVPARSFKEFLAYARGNPGRISYGSSGSGSAAHLTMELLKADAKIFLVHIPYRGVPQVVADMLAGNVHAQFAIAPGVLPHVKAGKMHALAVTSLSRSDFMPDVPSVKELGYPQLESLAWVGLLAPARIPADILERLSSEARRGLALPESRRLLTNAGFDVAASTASEFRSWQQAEIAKWGKVIRATGAKPD